MVRYADTYLDVSCVPATTANSAQALCRVFGYCNFGRTFVHLKTRTAAQLVAAMRYQ